MGQNNLKNNFNFKKNLELCIKSNGNRSKNAPFLQGDLTSISIRLVTEFKTSSFNSHE